MRVAVVGATGLTGRYAVEELRRSGHDAIEIARSRGVDVISGEGLDAALAGVGAVIDVLNVPAADVEAAKAAFGGATRNILAAERRANVAHHVLLSIVGMERIRGTPHYAGKREQEALVGAGSIPFTIQRATQFHEFAGMVVGWTRRDGAAYLPPLLVQPVAASDVAKILVELATGAPQGRAVDLAGPEPQDLVDMARRTLAARGESLRLVPTWRAAPFSVEAAGEVLLPEPGARLAPTTFDAWLVRQAQRTPS